MVRCGNLAAASQHQRIIMPCTAKRMQDPQARPLLKQSRFGKGCLMQQWPWSCTFVQTQLVKMTSNAGSELLLPTSCGASEIWACLKLYSSSWGAVLAKEAGPFGEPHRKRLPETYGALMRLQPAALDNVPPPRLHGISSLPLHQKNLAGRRSSHALAWPCPLLPENTSQCIQVN